MDDLTLRLAELESENEEMEKQIGRLSVQLRQLQEQQQTAQQQMLGILHTVQRHLDTLTARTDQLDETVDLLEDRYASLYKTVKVISHDIDQLYDDMNLLESETRSRAFKLREEIAQYLWDSAEEDDEAAEE